MSEVSLLFIAKSLSMKTLSYTAKQTTLEVHYNMAFM